MGIRPTLILKNQDTSILSAVDQLIRILENLKIPFIVVVEVEFEDVLHALKSSGLLNNRVSLILNYSKNKENNVS